MKSENKLDRIEEKYVLESPIMRYPEALVREFGAKAGVLLYVAQKRPDIPQAKMVTGAIDEPADSLLQKAQDAGIGPRRLFRSSAREEMEKGYDGVFDTIFDKGFYRAGFIMGDWISDLKSLTTEESITYEAHATSIINKIKYPPQELSEFFCGLLIPDRIGVIIAEFSDSQFAGTLIKHPNQPDTYFISLSYPHDDYAPKSSYSYRPGEGVRPIPGMDDELGLTTGLEQSPVLKELEEVCSWHDQIAFLGEMDPAWTYKIEFGLYPKYLYQFSPFKRVQFADYNLEPNDGSKPFLSIGITPPEGIELKLFWADREKEFAPTSGGNYVYLGGMKDPRNLNSNERAQFQAAILIGSSGFLSHNTVRMVRAMDTTVLDPSLSLYTSFIRTEAIGARITSDGRVAKVAAIK